MSPKTVTDEPMAEKKRKPEADKKNGRPKVLPPELDTRIQIRASKKLVAVWKAHAVSLGYGDVSAWIRKLAADALRQPSR
jgi:hypothetical protein